MVLRRADWAGSAWHDDRQGKVLYAVMSVLADCRAMARPPGRLPPSLAAGGLELDERMGGRDVASELSSGSNR